MCREHERCRRGRHHDCLRAVCQDCRALDLVADIQVLELIDRRVEPAALEVDLGRRVLLLVRYRLPPDFLQLLVDRLLAVPEAPADAPDPHVVDDDVSVVEREAELIAVLLDKRLSKRPVVAAEKLVGVFPARLDNHECRLRALVPYVEIFFKDDLVVFEALVLQRLSGLVFQPLHLALQLAHDLASLLRPDGRVGLLALVDDVGQRHAVGREHRRVPVDQNLLDAERASDGHGVLAAGGLRTWRAGAWMSRGPWLR